MTEQMVSKPSEVKPIKTERRFFGVFIVESPSCRNFYNNIREGEILQQILRLSGLIANYTLVADKQHFERALTEGIKPYLEKRPGWFAPILHISAHSNQDGIGFTCGDRILSWDELRELITPINVALRGNLVLCLSGCQSVYGCTMAMKKGKTPFLTLVANDGEPLWSDTVIAFATFYHHLAKGNAFHHAETAMQAAADDKGFQLHFGEDIQRIVFQDRLKSLE